MQILASIIDVVKSSLVATRRERGITYSRTLFCNEDYQSSLQVRRDLQSDFVFFCLSQRLPSASEERIIVGLVLSFFYWMTDWTCQ